MVYGACQAGHLNTRLYSHIVFSLLPGHLLVLARLCQHPEVGSRSGKPTAAVACVTETRLMNITHSLSVVSSLPPAPILPPLSVQMEWISDER